MSWQQRGNKKCERVDDGGSVRAVKSIEKLLLLFTVAVFQVFVFFFSSSRSQLRVSTPLTRHAKLTQAWAKWLDIFHLTWQWKDDYFLNLLAVPVQLMSAWPTGSSCHQKSIARQMREQRDWSMKGKWINPTKPSTEGSHIHRAEHQNPQ